MVLSEAQGVLEEDDGAEFREVVFNVETVLFAFNYSVAPGDRDIVDANLTFMAATELEFGLLVCYCEHVDVSRCVLIQRHRLQKDVFLIGLGLIDVDQFEKILALLENVGVALLADLAFEFLPVVRGYIFTVFLLLALCFDPRLEAFEVNESDRASALAGKN